ncbi:hypothetical protein CIPAW_05G234100 [Carya illinoinensis]|uniref:Uncharacterized protein n=1 Tax=Carya illinoinensis TaxID=32201 RepID=A0A8T1QMB5_CARIL|nr:hypothetical protein CIPAW_05G234100 [Carya illinoinensis]
MKITFTYVVQLQNAKYCSQSTGEKWDIWLLLDNYGGTHT